VRLVAEVRRVTDAGVDRMYGGGLVRSELLLRSVGLYKVEFSLLVA
jgi:hypothetical protein